MSGNFWMNKEKKDNGWSLVIADYEGFVIDASRPSANIKEVELPDGGWNLGACVWNPIIIRHKPLNRDDRFSEILDFIREKSTFATLTYIKDGIEKEEWKLSDVKFGVEFQEENGTWAVKMYYSGVIYNPKITQNGN